LERRASLGPSVGRRRAGAPVGNRQSAIGNQQSAICQSLISPPSAKVGFSQ